MPTTANKGLSVQTAGSNAGIWGVGAATALNEGVISLVDTMIGGINTVSLSSTTPVPLSAVQTQQALIRFTGTLLANIVVTTTCLGTFAVENVTSGNFSLTISNSVGATAIIPQNTTRDLFADATNGVRARGLPPPGTVVYMATPTAALHPSLAGEYVLPFGQSLATATYPGLFAAFGYTYGGASGNFTMPDMRGRSLFGMDNMGGSAANRVTTAGSGIDGTSFGATGGSQSGTLSIGNLPAHTHANSLSDPTHTHTAPANRASTSDSGGGSYNGGGTTQGSLGSLTNAAATGITITNASVGSGTAFGIMNPAFLCNIMIKT